MYAFPTAVCLSIWKTGGVPVDYDYFPNAQARRNQVDYLGGRTSGKHEKAITSFASARTLFFL